MDPSVDPVLGIIPPTPAEPVVEFSIAHLEYVAQCAQDAGVLVEVVASANPGLVPIGSSSPRSDEIVGRCLELGREEGWLIPNPFDGSAEANRLLYNIWIEIHECLVNNGYPTTEPPSEDVFVEEGDAIWNPYQGMLGDKIFVDPYSDWGPTGTIPGSIVRQLEAQDLCGASEAVMYAEMLADDNDG